MTKSKTTACNKFAHYLGRFVLKSFGWTIKGSPPDVPNMVIIAAPHTTNWDFIFLLAAAYAFGLRVNWLGKSTLFFPLFGLLLRYLGGISVDRSQANNLVQVLAAEIEQGNGINLVVPPAGTRRRTNSWKSGFYRIAEAAQIPIVCGYLDYDKKEAGLGPAFLTTDLKSDMDKIREFYLPIAAKFPENKSDIRLLEEDL